jgi:hypothetical protein
LFVWLLFVLEELFDVKLFFRPFHTSFQASAVFLGIQPTACQIAYDASLSVGSSRDVLLLSVLSFDGWFCSVDCLVCSGVVWFFASPNS